MDVLLKDEIYNKKYIVKYIKVNDLPLLINSYLGQNKNKITEIFWRFNDNILPNQIKIIVKNNKSESNLYKLDMENVYYTNVTHISHLTKIYYNIFYEKFSQYNANNIFINFGCENFVEILVVYENYNNIDNNINNDDIFYL
jgi:hypothetical protein